VTKEVISNGKSETEDGGQRSEKECLGDWMIEG